MFRDIKIKYCLIAALCAAVQAFGIYHIHAQSGVTEGGVIGLNLLLHHWFGISPAITNFVVSAICYFAGWRLLGRKFLIYSAVATGAFSVAYRIIEQFEPLWPELYNAPLAAALLGAVFVGVTAGGCIRVGGAMCGDDAFAMSLSHVTGLKIQQVYLISDLTVLGLSMTYIPFRRIIYSLITVLLSGQIIGWIQRFPLGGENVATEVKEG